MYYNSWLIYKLLFANDDTWLAFFCVFYPLSHISITASLSESESEPFLSQAQRVRGEIRARFLSSHQVLHEREAALLSELDQLVASYEWEEVRNQIQQLSISKESIMSVLKENESHEALELSIAPLNSRIRELEASLEAAEARMESLELEWDEELEIKLSETGGIRIIGKLDYKKKGEPVREVCRHSLEHGGGRDDDSGDCGRGRFDGRWRPEPYIPPTPSDQEGDIFVNVTKGINFSKYENIPAQLTGRDPTQHITSFSQARLSEKISENVSKAGYTEPTPVQKYAIPAILSGRDLMGCSQTGSGKTAAFLLPILSLMLSKGLYQEASMDPGTAHPTALIVTPMRELALKIFHEARKLSYSTIIDPVVAYGGTSAGYQLRNLEKGCHVLVGTPGRLIDFMTRGKVRLDKVKFLVFYEADLFLDMGFIPELKKIVHEFDMCQKSDRQILMFSVALPEEFQRLAADFLNDYLFLTVGKIGGPANDIVQKIVCVEALKKKEKLTEILRSKPEDKVLVFVETKRQANFLATYLSQENFSTTMIHGARQQRGREEVLDAFKTGKTQVLVVTSVTAQGLDIPKVNHVVNFDMPTDISQYVHRIGRTGRIGHVCLATSFFDTSKDTPIARSLIKVLSDSEQDVPTFLEEIVESTIGTGYGAVGGNFRGTDRRQGGGGRKKNFKGGSGGFRSQSFGDPINTGFNSSVPPTAEDDENWD